VISPHSKRAGAGFFHPSLLLFSYSKLMLFPFYQSMNLLFHYGLVYRMTLF